MTLRVEQGDAERPGGVPTQSVGTSKHKIKFNKVN